MSLRGDLLRSKNIALLGSGPGAWNPRVDLAANTAEMLETLVKSGATNEIRVVKLADVESEWSQKLAAGTRLVFEP